MKTTVNHLHIKQEVTLSETSTLDIFAGQEKGFDNIQITEDIMTDHNVTMFAINRDVARTIVAFLTSVYNL